MKIDKTKLVDTMGRPLSQSLFLEIGYSDYAYYTLKDDHYAYKGVTYPSLKKLYIEAEDPVEYEFACTYLIGWNHWEKLQGNKVLLKHIDSWRKELELKLRSEQFKAVLDLTMEGHFQASKWIADKGWDKKGAGRPSTKAQEIEDELNRQISEDYSADIVRLAK